MSDTTPALARQNGAIEILRDADGPGFALTFAAMRARVEGLNEFYQGVMQEGTDYGVIPGTPKPTLFQPGAQLLDGIFGLAPTFIEQPSSVRDFERGFFSFDVTCRLLDRRTGDTVAEGGGHCNSKEDKYRWRASKRSCPQCGAEAIIKGKAEYGGGWLCFARKGGCGAKFVDGDASIVTQAEGRVENDDTYTLVNTILKMAQKRAHVAATLNATGASRIFTQDIEDLPEFHRRASEAAAQSVEAEFREQPSPPPQQRQQRHPEPPKPRPSTPSRPPPPDLEDVQQGPPPPDELEETLAAYAPAEDDPERTDAAWLDYRTAYDAAIGVGLTVPLMRTSCPDGVLADTASKLRRAVNARLSLAKQPSR